MWNDFKAFAFKGNVLDLAVGVVIGAAFTAVVNALVGGVIMPVVGAISPNNPWQDWTVWKLQLGVVLAAALNFLIVAFVLFIVVSKVVGALRARTSEPPAAAAPTPQEKLLAEIRDLLKQRA